MAYEDVTLSDHTLRVFKLKPTNQRNEPPVVTAVAAQPNGSLLAMTGEDHDIHTWNIRTRRLVKKLNGHFDWIRRVTFSPDGRVLASAGNDRRILFWDTQSWNQMFEAARHQQAFMKTAFDTPGKYLATTGFEPDFRIYDTVSDQLLFRLIYPSEDMRTVAFLPMEVALPPAFAMGLCEFGIFPLASNCTTFGHIDKESD